MHSGCNIEGMQYSLSDKWPTSSNMYIPCHCTYLRFCLWLPLPTFIFLASSISPFKISFQERFSKPKRKQTVSYLCSNIIPCMSLFYYLLCFIVSVFINDRGQISIILPSLSMMLNIKQYLCGTLLSLS